MFKAQDVVKHENGDRGEVVFGPFRPALIEGPAYLVQWSDGRYEGSCAVIYEQHLTLAPKFQVGQKVTFKYSSTQYEVVAGPFPEEDDLFWVYKDQDGDHGMAYEIHMVPVVE